MQKCIDCFGNPWYSMFIEILSKYDDIILNLKN